MRIAYVSSNFSVYDARFLTKMVAAGLEILYVAMIHRPETRRLQYFAALSRLPGVTRCLVEPRFPPGRLSVTINKFWYVRELRRQFARFKPDVVHGGYGSFDGFHCALTGYRPFLYMAWGSDVLLEPQSSVVNRWKVGHTIRRADLVTCDSEYQKQAVMRVGGVPAEKVVTFPWGIERDIFRPRDDRNLRRELGWNETHIVLLMNRLMAPVYGHDNFITAFIRLAARHPGLRLVLLNDGPLREALLARLRNAGLAERCHYGGEVSLEKMAEYLNNSDIYVSASASDGTSCSMLEAMACGLPVVVTDVPVNDEWVTPGVNGLVARRGDADDLEQALDQMIAEPELRARCRAANLRLAEERADWNRNFAVLLDIYRRLRPANAKARVG